MLALPGGRLLALDGLHPGGRVRKLAAGKPGSFWRPDVSFDGQRVLFCYKAADEKSFHLHEINIDGTGHRQLTFSDYDDLDPIYLPDGHIMFTTTRCNTYVRCSGYSYSYILARCDSDGRNVYLVSQGSEPDWLPSLLHDGRVIYSRWEYTDKPIWRMQSLWATNPDGTGTVTFWGNQSVWPDPLAEPRAIPGSHRVMFTGTCHHDWFAGSIGIIDPLKGFNFPAGLAKVTADVPCPEVPKPPVDPMEAEDYHRSGALTAYKSPYPLFEEDFLVSARIGKVPSRDGPGHFQLYLMDVHGNRELIYRGRYNVWYAMPVRPRKVPPKTPDRVAWPGTGPDRKPPEMGTLYSADVCEGVSGLPRELVKYVRVLQLDSRTYTSWTRDGRFSGPVVSVVQDDGVKRVLGTAKVREDGSVYFKVPAGKALHFQLLDEKYRALHTMRSFTGVMPGEHRGCVGCHEMHSTTPAGKGLALRDPPATLTPPPWGTTGISYERHVQPVLDKYCGKCHQGEGEAREAFDLTFRPSGRQFREGPNHGLPCHWMLDPVRNKYVLYGRTHLVLPTERTWYDDKGPRHHHGGRCVARVESSDFLKWNITEPRESPVIMAADTEDLPGDEIYSMKVFPYESVYIGMVQVFHNRPDACTLDVQLAVSHDSYRFTRVGNRETFLPLGPIGTWDRFNISLANNPPIAVGDELRVYFGCQTTRHNPYKGDDKGPHGGGVGFATMPRDRFVSVGASYDGGEIRTKPLQLRGNDLHINAKSDFGEIVVEVLDKMGNQIAKSKAIRCDSLDTVVDWETGSLNGVNGPIVLNITLKNAFLFALWSTNPTSAYKETWGYSVDTIPAFEETSHPKETR
ncbi:MAG: hypothetical protein ABIP48_12755 [Planctomycetota bacterium]